EGASVPIHRTYSQKANLLLVTLLDTPVCDKKALTAFLKRELANYGAVYDVRLCYWRKAPKYLMPRAIALFDLDEEPSTIDRLPSFIRCPDTGATISLRWKNAPPACNYCKLRGHRIDECDKRTRYTKRARRNAPKPDHAVAPAETSASSDLPTPSITITNNH